MNEHLEPLEAKNIKRSYTCRNENCPTVACFGYDNERNIYCVKHKQDDMCLTFKYEDFTSIDIFDLNKPYKTNKTCIMKGCNTTASCNFINESKGLFCSKHKLDYMLNPQNCSCKSGKYRLYNILGNKISICCEDCKTDNMCHIFERMRLNKNDNGILCTICHTYQPKSNFTGYSTTCTKCRCMKHITYVNSNRDVFLNCLLRHARGSAKERLENGRINASIFEINLDDLISTCNKQKGLCYYSNYPMTFSTLSDFMCSIERLDTDKGYTKDNTVLVIKELNGFCQWTKEKFNKFISMASIDHEQNIADFSQNTIKKKQEFVTRDNGMKKCRTCNIMKNAEEFYSNSLYDHCCKACRKIQGIKNLETPRGSFNAFLSKCKAKHRNNPDRNFGECTLTFDDLVELFNNQKGLCAYSGIPLHFGSTKEKDWVCSLERIDPLQGYIKSNICFIIYELNTPDFTSVVVNKDIIKGSGAWSKKKVEMVKEYIKENNLL